MRAVLQRVTSASVTVKDTEVGAIKNGLLVLLGVTNEDTQDDIDWLVRKIVRMRIFSDTEGLMNLDLKTINGDLLVVSQFTLYASIKKGNRPSYTRAGEPDFAKEMYQKFIKNTEKELCKKIETGIFAADMEISLLNDGPVTIIVDSKQRDF